MRPCIRKIDRQHNLSELPTWLIKLFTAEGDLVLDPFVGSGTTVEAAKLLGRRYCGIDIDPEFHLLAASRVVEKQARLLESPETCSINWERFVQANSKNLDLDTLLPKN